jgi:hypothetical protein
MKKSKLMIIALLLGLSLLVVPIVSASQMSFPAGVINKSVPNDIPYGWQLIPGPIQYSMHIRVDSQQYRNFTYQSDTHPPPEFPEIPVYRFVTVIPYGSYVWPLPIN